MQPKFVAAQKMLLKRNQQTFVNGLLGFNTLIYAPLEARVYVLTIITELPIDMGSISLLINILLGSFQLFLHSDQPL